MSPRSVLALVAVAAVLPACGSDSLRDIAVDQCMREARRIDDPAARQAAEQGCDTARDGEVNADDAKRSARRRCIEEAGRIANPAARREAERECEAVR